MSFTPDEALAALAAVRESAHAAFGDHHAGRLAQLDAALATAEMAITHLVDEEDREVDLANRIVDRDTVHTGHEVTSPVGRAYKDTLRIAGKG